MKRRYVVKAVVEEQHLENGEWWFCGDVHATEDIAVFESDQRELAEAVAESVANPIVLITVHGGCVIDDSTDHPNLAVEVRDEDVMEAEDE